jgi:hypothetical protein
MFSFRSLYTALAAVAALGVSAQQPVDIGLYQDGDLLEVRVRPQSDFDGVFANVVFTLRWERTSAAALGPLRQQKSSSTYMPLQPSGPVHQVGDFNYQIYTGFGFETVASSSGGAWRAGQEYTIAFIPVNGAAEFHIANDAWTNEITNNGNYYVSLGGLDKTGIIYKGVAGNAGSSTPLSIVPNPNRGQFTITMPVNSSDNMWFEIVNTAGQVVYRETPNAAENSFRKDMDLSNEGAGVYHLRIHRANGTENHRIVIN